MERNLAKKSFLREREAEELLKDFGCDADRLVIFFMYLSEILE
jgi:hypothetical protein